MIHFSDIADGILGGLFGDDIARFFGKRRWLFNFLLGVLVVFLIALFFSIKQLSSFNEVLQLTIFNKYMYFVGTIVGVFFMVMGLLDQHSEHLRKQIREKDKNQTEANPELSPQTKDLNVDETKSLKAKSDQ